MKYIPGLNGIRAVAVIIVVVFHWTQGLPDTSAVKRYIINGNFGVNIFFVLSGFLITSILLHQKVSLSSPGNTRKKILISFYIRRVLRIFPIYYLTIFLLLFTSLPGYRHNLLAYLTYTENFHIIFTHSWDSFTHTWSLAVEEQFYLIWPWIIMFTPLKYLRRVFLVAILLGPLFSIFQTLIMQPKLNAFILTPSCFDAFGIGALLAWHYCFNNLCQVIKWIKILLPFSIISLIYWQFAPGGGHFQYFARFFESIIGAAMISFCLSKKFTRSRNILLENTVVRQIGVVSYGIYLFHYSLPYFYSRIKIYFLGVTTMTFFDYFLMTFLLLATAFFSYYVIEKPILKLKKHFKY